MKKFKVQSAPKIIPLTLSVVIISVMMCLSIMAWNPPGQTPPGGNAKEPINVGIATQSKAGGLNISGAVGIGTTSPTEKLELSSGSNIKFTDNGVIKSMDNNHALLFRRSENKIELREYGDIIFSPGATAGAETAKMVIKSNGAVGIGTTSPSTKLVVAGEITSTSANAYRMVYGNYGSFFRNDGSNTYLLLTNSADQYGIWNGLRPLQINNATGDVYFSQNNNFPGSGIWNTAGNVGIGTRSPQNKLTVTGTTNISRDGTWECCSNGDFTLSLGENTSATGKKAGIQFHNSGVSEGQLRLDAGRDGRELKAYSYQTDMDLHATGYVQGDKGLCIGNDCCTSWADCLGTPPDPFFLPPGGCTATLPAGNKKIFVTSTSYDDSTVHAANQTNHMANADNACQARAAAAGLTGTYRALMYETVLYGTSSCNATTVLRQPYDILPAAALWNGERIGATANCEWRLVATSPSDMLDIDGDGNYLKNPIRCDEFGQPTSKQVFTNFQPTGSGTYNTANTCLAVDTCHYYTRGCYYGNSASKDVNWAGAYYHWDSMGSCPAACSSTQRALYCVEQ